MIKYNFDNKLNIGAEDENLVNSVSLKEDHSTTENQVAQEDVLSNTAIDNTNDSICPTNIEAKHQQHQNIKDVEEQTIASIEKAVEEAIRNAQKEFEIKAQEHIEKLLLPKIKAIKLFNESLDNRENEISLKEAEAQLGFPKLVEDRFAIQKKQLEDVKAEFAKKLDELNIRESEILKRESDLVAKESSFRLDLDKERADCFNQMQNDKRALNDELIELRKKTQSEISQNREDSIKKLMDELSRKNSELAKRNAEEQEKREKEFKLKLDEMFKERSDLLLKREKEVAELSAKTNETQKDICSREAAVQKQKALLDETQSNIEDEIAKRVKAREESFSRREVELGKEIERLRAEVENYRSIADNYADLSAKLGNQPPEFVIARLAKQEASLKEARESLLAQNSQDDEERIKSFKKEIMILKQQNDELSERNRILEQSKTNNELMIKCNELELENSSLQKRVQSVDECNKILTSQIERMASTYGTAKNRDERIKDVTSPLFDGISKLGILHKNEKTKVNDFEVRWLNNIITNSQNFGLHFPKRLVYAFHTCLKTAEWSPITVLAGVSGTGKSELPRYYSLFGGIKFLPVAVQPNWDSQEAMLGYFNSIDNKFDAQPLLRFLSQCSQKNSIDYPEGLGDSVNLVLLDEMNLAHVELYFADFLSKLETRRGKFSELPSVDVKLGAGITPYPLSLTRNVLWVGTMNQDETTKSLSDKVLDRGNVLFFPRPKVLKSRKSLKNLPTQAYRLSKDLWNDWCKHDVILSEEEIRPYREIVQKINDALSYVGRALGHRVWQSIEFYMNNYPDICVLLYDKKEITDRSGVDEKKLKRFMNIAFEDALVQKVMPKLRGIETDGESRENCLNRIRELLSEEVNGMKLSLITDFNLACNNPFGQFIWNSANYISESESLFLNESEIEK